MLKLALDGFWLLGALGAVFLLGVFSSQYIKDKISGVPSDLRAALRALETKASADVATAKAKVVADAVKTISPAMPVVVKPLTPAPLVNPNPAQPAA
jgi:hypothetical protein